MKGDDSDNDTYVPSDTDWSAGVAWNFGHGYRINGERTNFQSMAASGSSTTTAVSASASADVNILRRHLTESSRPVPRTVPAMLTASPVARLLTSAVMLGLGFCPPLSRATEGSVDLVFAGDIMLADLPGKAIARGVDPFAEFAEILHAADATIGNLECVVATTGEAVKKPWTFRAAPQVMPVLARHFGIVSLANNHTGDFGPAAFLEQLGWLEKSRIHWFGGGRDCARARTPHLIEAKGLRIALLGYNDFKPRQFEAGPAWPGVAWSVDEQVLADIRFARTHHRADLVIPFMHWGSEHEPENDCQKALARLMIDAGADLVVGGHPHVTQGTEIYQGKPIIYSLGNFVFDGFEEGPARTGWLLRLRLDKTGVVAWDTVVAQLDAEGIPHLQREVPSPSGSRASAVIENRRALIDSPLAAPTAP
jgi:poly-gamma-glutamate synthesis protein (capsule biosynthesis protein)